MSASAPMDSLRRISEELTRRSRFLITSHARPDGDSIGSQVAIAAALRAMGKTVRLVNRDAPPPAYLAFPGVSAIEVADKVEGDYDAAIVLECSDITRPGVAGLDKYFVINIDHHAGNAQYGAVNYYDEGAAACGELVADVIDVLDMPWSVEIGIALYLTILTDTGSFRHGSMTSRTFEVCRRAADAGANPAAIATTVFDSSSVGKLKLIGAVLDTMRIECEGRLAVLEYSDRLLAETGTTVYDTDGVINMPFMASSIEAVALVRAEGTRQVRVSLRSKGDLDVRAIAGTFGGGGHRNASGFTVEGDASAVREQVVGLLKQALGVAQPSPA
jgi:bifunctional oligoribonuclease and PAP phosphatase NrnA